MKSARDAILSMHIELHNPSRRFQCRLALLASIFRLEHPISHHAFPTVLRFRFSARNVVSTASLGSGPPQYVAASIPYRVPLKLAALGSTVVNFLSSRASQSHGGELVSELNPKYSFGSQVLRFYSHLATAFHARAVRRAELLLAAEKWCSRGSGDGMGRPAASEPQSPVMGGRLSLPMSPHGKRLWPEAARRVGTLDLVLWSRWIVGGGVVWTTGFGGYVLAARLLGMLLSGRLPSEQPRNERESVASAPHGHPGHFSPSRLQLASMESPSGERGLPDYIRICPTDDTPSRPAATLSVPSTSTPSLCMRIRRPATPPTPTDRAAAKPAPRVMEQKPCGPTRRINSSS
ncbi:hypothetical protein N657DRAFT_465653 [Parathielavia appendiculata]|uniref:Uncharacterized protein n=1 Tax=Parathielavia appendiculata TaxID=2587402 RepID=A0AAN6TNW0_9PEZI|nr:hypothetical protein N657DRAFT_465653 [Parathielavia appendiculata]